MGSTTGMATSKSKCAIFYLVIFLAAASNLAQAQESLNGTYKLFNLTKLYLPLGVGLSYANISSNPAAFITATTTANSAAKVLGTTSRQQVEGDFFQGASNVCPESIELGITAPNSIVFPDGLKDSSGKCKAKPGLNKTKNFLVDAGAMIGSFFLQEPAPTYLKAMSQFKFAKVPNGTWVCPDAPAGTPPVAQISINSLAQQLVAIIKASGIAMKIPVVILDKVFGKVRQMGTLPRGPYPDGWKEEYLNVTTKGLRNRLAAIKNTPMIILKSNPKDSPANTFECFYVRETTEKNISDVSKSIEEITEKIVPLMLQSTQKAVQLKDTKFFVADSRCPNTSTHSISEISFPPTTPTLPPVASVEVKDITIDGKVCATATKMARLFDLESFISDTRSDIVAKKMVAYFKDNTRFSKMGGLMLDSILGQLSNLAPHGFAETLGVSTTKSAIVLATIDVSKCEHINDKSTLSALIVQKYSAAGYFCNKLDGAPTPSSGCDGNLALQASHSALVFRDAKDIPECIFSSDETIAGKFKAVAKSSPSPPPKNSSGDPGTPVDPKSNNATKPCFPASSRVLLSNGKFSTMKDLSVGDSIQVAPGVFEPVLMFTHATPSIRSDMVVVESTSGAQLVASPGHLVYLNGRVAETKQAKAGDTIMVEQDGTLVEEIVTSVKVEQMDGLYNPQTPSGNILVHNGRGPDTSAVLATTYTTVVPYTAAHSLLAPIRFVQSWFGTLIPAMSELFPETENVHPKRHHLPLVASV